MLIQGCTRVENPGGGGVRDVFAKIPRGGQGFQEKLPGGSTYFAFYCIFINKFSETLPGGVLFHTPPPYPPLCASMCWSPVLISWYLTSRPWLKTRIGMSWKNFINDLYVGSFKGFPPFLYDPADTWMNLFEKRQNTRKISFPFLVENIIH